MTEVETLMGLLILLMAITGLGFARRPTVKNGIFFGLVCAAATLAKPVALLYPAMYLVLLGARALVVRRREGNQQRQIRLGPVVSMIATMAICLAPWIARNMVLTHGRFRGVSSNGPAEFLRGYVNAEPRFAFLRQNFGGGSAEQSKELWDAQANIYEDEILKRHGARFFNVDRIGMDLQFVGGEMTSAELEAQKEEIEKAEVKRRLLYEPGGVMRKFLIQLATFWYIVETPKKSMLVGGIAFVCLCLAAYGWIQARRHRIEIWPVASVIIYFNLIYALILALGRYSMPVYPTLLVLVSYGLCQIIGGGGNRSRRCDAGGNGRVSLR
jgi:hypothetical protein